MDHKHKLFFIEQNLIIQPEPITPVPITPILLNVDFTIDLIMFFKFNLILASSGVNVFAPKSFIMHIAFSTN